MRRVAFALTNLVAVCHSAAACETDEDCSLLGQCIDSACKCDAGWKGEKCGQLDFLPAKRDWGYRNSSMASWCGSATKVGDEYHFFGSGMSGNCTLSNFNTNSMAVRATAKNPEGPYEYQETVLEEFAHSTSIRRTPDGGFLLFTIGKDMHGENVHQCTGDGVQKDDDHSEKEVVLGPHDYVRLATSSSVTGPWKDRVIMQTDIENPTAWNCNKSNPSGFMFPNGSILMMYRGVPCERTEPCRNKTTNLCQHQGIAYAESADSPFVDRNGQIDALSGNEDAFFWQGKRGFHVIFHSKNACTFEDQGGSCGSMAFSRDTWHWTLNDAPVFDGAIEWEESTGKITPDTLEARQRPYLLFDEDGVTPLFLINGAAETGISKQFSSFVPINVEANQHLKPQSFAVV